MLLHVGLSLGICSRSQTSERTLALSASINCQYVLRSGWGFLPISPSMLDPCLAWVCIGLIYAVVSAVGDHMCSCPVMSRFLAPITVWGMDSIL